MSYEERKMEDIKGKGRLMDGRGLEVSVTLVHKFKIDKRNEMKCL